MSQLLRSYEDFEKYLNFEDEDIKAWAVDWIAKRYPDKFEGLLDTLIHSKNARIVNTVILFLIRNNDDSFLDIVYQKAKDCQDKSVLYHYFEYLGFNEDSRYIDLILRDYEKIKDNEDVDYEFCNFFLYCRNERFRKILLDILDKTKVKNIVESDNLIQVVKLNSILLSYRYLEDVTRLVDLYFCSIEPEKDPVYPRLHLLMLSRNHKPVIELFSELQDLDIDKLYHDQIEDYKDLHGLELEDLKNQMEHNYQAYLRMLFEKAWNHINPHKDYAKMWSMGINPFEGKTNHYKYEMLCILKGLSDNASVIMAIEDEEHLKQEQDYINSVIFGCLRGIFGTPYLEILEHDDLSKLSEIELLELYDFSSHISYKEKEYIQEIYSRNQDLFIEIFRKRLLNDTEMEKIRLDSVLNLCVYPHFSELLPEIWAAFLDHEEVNLIKYNVVFTYLNPEITNYIKKDFDNLSEVKKITALSMLNNWHTQEAKDFVLDNIGEWLVNYKFELFNLMFSWMDKDIFIAVNERFDSMDVSLAHLFKSSKGIIDFPPELVEEAEKIMSLYDKCSPIEKFQRVRAGELKEKLPVFLDFKCKSCGYEFFQPIYKIYFDLVEEVQEEQGSAKRHALFDFIDDIICPLCHSKDNSQLNQDSRDILSGELSMTMQLLFADSGLAHNDILVLTPFRFIDIEDELYGPKGGIHKLRRLLEKNPNDIKYRFMLADLLNLTGEKKKALATYNQIVQMSPDLINTYIVLANSMAQKEQYQKAFDFMARGISRLKGGKFIMHPDDKQDPFIIKMYQIARKYAEKLDDTSFEQIRTKYPIVDLIEVENIKRNEDCPCGSGRKFKKCCEKLIER